VVSLLPDLVLSDELSVLSPSHSLPALKVALAGSVETQGAHEGDSGEESQAGGANLGHIALVSNLGESSGAREFLRRGGGHDFRRVDGEDGVGRVM